MYVHVELSCTVPQPYAAFVSSHLLPAVFVYKSRQRTFQSYRRGHLFIWIHDEIVWVLSSRPDESIEVDANALVASFLMQSASKKWTTNAHRESVNMDLWSHHIGTNAGCVRENRVIGYCYPYESVCMCECVCDPWLKDNTWCHMIASDQHNDIMHLTRDRDSQNGGLPDAETHHATNDVCGRLCAQSSKEATSLGKFSLICCHSLMLGHCRAR